MVNEAVRWSSTTTVSWTPILTFTRRRLEVLDWIEENVQPTAFTDDPAHAGVAFGNHQKIRFDRASLLVELSEADASVDSVEKVLGGVWRKLQPKDTRFNRYRAAVSVPLSTDYDRARHAFTARTLSGRRVFESFESTAYDCSSLLNVRTPLGTLSIEFGVVSRDELIERLSNPDLGQMQTTSDERAPVVATGDSLPAVSAFFDIYLASSARLLSGGAIAEVIRRADVLTRGLASEIAATL